jgi:hypothetical protein
MKKLFIESTLAAQYGHRWPAAAGEMKTLLGLKGKKLPRTGVPAQIVQGIKVWVEPFTPLYKEGMYLGQVRRVKSSKHRVMAECPLCQWQGSAGRLQQHKCKVNAQ